MSVRNLQELLDMTKGLIGDDTSDKALEYIADLTDTVNASIDTKEDAEDWKAKYEENDKAWREKYRDRFFNTTVSETYTDELEPPVITETKKSYDELFKTN